MQVRVVRVCPLPDPRCQSPLAGVCAHGVDQVLDDANGTIELKIGNGYDGPMPAGLVEGGPIGTRELRERLRDLGERVVRSGLGGTEAATALLLRRPQSAAGPLLADGEKIGRAHV